ncbi:type II toxin-antitoxin system prevent-host-death family antitoxin [Xylophilus rhododendri]|uniref:Type II toxin-antitoxin system prevent-host-death family antitoxin n=1 Tax=Xylophilus rhododendri TaxID=2697032 RepID=A0A857J3E3_9BURK|nr:type II toxin-antitoxin system Phd/YefM family antitoxin [Xylophilus rhododendri]QHI97388.1 type II toxin-antitoxin system prevent-host-death family antitoxin [Xylophilus rhododendri]
MKTVSVRELRNTMPHLRETLEQEQELLLVSNGEPVARILPVEPAPARRPQLPDIRAFREAQPRMERPLEDLIREERDRR